MRTSLHTLSIIALYLIIRPIQVAAQTGSLDPAFSTAGQYVQDFGFQDNHTKVRVQSDGKIVSVGTAITPSFSGKLLVMRLLPDGTSDSGFGSDGSLIINDFNESYAYDLFLQSDGRIVVVGARADANFQFAMLVIRLNEDGSLDDTFGTGGMTELELSTGDDFAYAVAPLSDGRFLLAGTALDDQFRNQPVVVCMNANGSVDETFGTDGVASLDVVEIDNKFWSVGVQSDGSIVASGHIDQGLTGSGQFNFDVLVARFTSSGILDPTFGNAGTVAKPISAELNESAQSMAIGPDDAIYLGGYTTQPDFSFDGFIVKLDADGADASGFGTSGLSTFNNAVQDVFYGIALQPDGKILTCGTSGGFFFDPRDQLVARYTSGGILDNTFDTDGFALNNVAGNFDEANAITLQADGKIVTAGKANNAATFNDATVFRYLNDLSNMIDETAVNEGLRAFPNPAVAGGQVALAIDPNVQGPTTLRMFDARGRDVAIASGNAPMIPWRVIALPVDLVPGIYTVLVTAGERIFSVRLTVQD